MLDGELHCDSESTFGAPMNERVDCSSGRPCERPAFAPARPGSPRAMVARRALIAALVSQLIARTSAPAWDWWRVGHCDIPRSPSRKSAWRKTATPELLNPESCWPTSRLGPTRTGPASPQRRMALRERHARRAEV
jgi:hypothetical protein